MDGDGPCVSSTWKKSLVELIECLVKYEHRESRSLVETTKILFKLTRSLFSHNLQPFKPNWKLCRLEQNSGNFN